MDLGLRARGFGCAPSLFAEGRMRSLADERDCAEIEHRLHALQLGDTPLWGQMRVDEMLCHVRGAFRAAMGEVLRLGEAPKQPLPPQLLKFFALRMPMQWPKGVPTLPALKVGAELMSPGAFEEERAFVLQEMGRFLQPEQRLVDHAMFGQMTRGDWMRWGFLHTDHHLRQFGR